MHSLYKYQQNEKATVCTQDTCVTVFGDTARIVNGIAVVAAILLAISLLDKALN